jgi:hypothetical protein
MSETRSRRREKRSLSLRALSLLAIAGFAVADAGAAWADAESANPSSVFLASAGPVARLDLPAEAIAGQPFVANASRSSSPNGPIVLYRFAVDGGAFDRGTQPSRSFTLTRSGAHFLSVQIADGSGGTATANATLAVVPNSPKWVNVSTPNAVANVDEIIAVCETAHDAYGNGISNAPSWYSTSGTFPSLTSFVARTPGRSVIVASVVDAGGSGTGSASIPVSDVLVTKVRVRSDDLPTSAVVKGARFTVEGAVKFQDDLAVPDGYYQANVEPASLNRSVPACSASGSISGGIFTFKVPLECSLLPGTYVVSVIARYGGNSGAAATTYSIHVG